MKTCIYPSPIRRNEERWLLSHRQATRILILLTLIWACSLGASWAEEAQSPLGQMSGVTSLRHDPANQGTVFFHLEGGPRRSAIDVIEEIAEWLDLDQDTTWVETQRLSGSIRFQQLHRQIPVVGGQLVIQESDLVARSVAGRIIKLFDISIEEPVSTDSAIEEALVSADAMGYEGASEESLRTQPQPELSIMSLDGSYSPESLELVYRFHLDLSTVFGGLNAVINARTGIVETLNPATRSVAGTGTTLYSGPRTFEVDFNASEAGLYSLVSPLHNIATRDLQGLDTPFWLIDSVPVTSTASVFAHPDHPPALEVHWATQEMINYLAVRHGFGYSSPIPLRSYVNCGEGADEAFSSPLTYSTCYGTSTQNGRSYGTIDVVGHETGHHITAATSGLMATGDAGALDESFGNIFGALLENHLTPPGNWKIGDLIDPPELLYNMADPKSQSLPTTYLGQNYYQGSDSSAGVYINLGVQDYWFYLVAEGTQGNTQHIDQNINLPSFTLNGIGIAKAGRIAVANLLSLPNSANYPIAAANSILHSGVLYGAYTPEQRTTHNAWFGVGVEPQLFQEEVISPEQGEVGLAPGVIELRWPAGMDSGVWDVEVSTTSDMQTIVASGPTSQVELTAEGIQAKYDFSGAQDNTTYYWRVRDALPNQFGETKSWRNLNTFNVSFLSPAPISPKGPADTITGQWHPWGLDFSWQHVLRAEQYHLQIWRAITDDCSEPTTLLIDQPGLAIIGSPAEGDPITHKFHVPVKEELCWRVRGEAFDDDANLTSSDWSNGSDFKTDLPKVEPISPVNDALTDPWGLTFTYDPPLFAREVRVEIAPHVEEGDGMTQYCSLPWKFDPEIDPFATFSVKNQCFAANENSPSGSLNVPITPKFKAGSQGMYGPSSTHPPAHMEYRFEVWGPEIGLAATVGSGLGEQGASSAKETFLSDGYSKFTPITGIFSGPSLDGLPDLGTYSGMGTTAPVYDYDHFYRAAESNTVTVTWAPLVDAEGYAITTQNFFQPDSGLFDSFRTCTVWITAADLPDPTQPSAEIPRHCLAYGGNTLGVMIQAHPYVVSPHMSSPNMTVEVGLPLIPVGKEDTRFKVFMADVTPPILTDINSPVAKAKTIENDGSITLEFDAHYSTADGWPNPSYPGSLHIAPWIDFDIKHEAGLLPNRNARIRVFKGPNCGTGLLHSWEGNIPLGNTPYGTNLQSLMAGETFSVAVYPWSRHMGYLEQINGTPVDPHYDLVQCRNVKVQIDWSWPEPEPEPEPEPTPPAPGAVPCQQTVHAGGDDEETHVIELGTNSGTTTLYLDTINLPDEIFIYYENQEILRTGCYGTNGLSGCNGTCCCDGLGLCGCSIPYSGISTQMTVRVDPNCQGTEDTGWRFSLACP